MTNDTNVVDFSWQTTSFGEADCGSKANRLVIDNDSDFSSPIYNSGALSESTTSQTVTIDSPEGVVYWRVRSSNEQGGAWSPSQSLTLNYEAPTAEVTSPASGVTIGYGVAQSFSATSYDITGPLTKMNLYRAHYSGGVLTDVTALDQPGGVVDQSCSGTSCTITREWTPQASDSGTWVVYMNANDILEAYDGSCTGAPSIANGSNVDCGRTGLTDYITVTVQNDPPVVSQVTGANNARLGLTTPNYNTSQYISPFNLIYQDDNKQEVDTKWSSSCPLTNEYIDHIDIVAKGDFGDGAWPDMDLVLSDPVTGARGAATCSFTVNSSSYSTYSCGVGQETSTIDVVFPNDAATGPSDDRNLYVDYIDVHFDNSGTNYVRLQAEDASVNANYVVFDHMNGVFLGVYETVYDGLSYDGSPALAGREAMYRAGSLRFPVPLSFQPAVPAPTTCTLTGTATDSAGATGSSTLNVNICGGFPDSASNPNPSVGQQNVSLPVTVSWDTPASWGNTCNIPNRTYTVYAGVKSGGVCPDPGVPGAPGAGYSALATCTNLPDGTSSCSDNFFNVRDTEFCWFVETNNGEYSTFSATDPSGVWWFEVENPLVYQNWLTTLYGDFYAQSLTTEFPDPVDYAAPWSPPYSANENGSGVSVAMITSGDINITTSDTTSGYNPESETPLWVKYANFVQTWPVNYSGVAPSNATDLPESGDDTDCPDIFGDPHPSEKIRRDTVYKIDLSCANEAINNTINGSDGGYITQNPGVVVVYVQGSGDLRISEPFVNNNPPDDRRILFVTGPNVHLIFDQSLDSGDPDQSTPPLVEAGFVVQNSVEFEGAAGGSAGDLETNPDTSIVVEGPIIAKSALFNRNRGLTNGYPSEVIKYNNDIIYRLTNQERSSTQSNYTGLFVIDVDWISEE